MNNKTLIGNLNLVCAVLGMIVMLIISFLQKNDIMYFYIALSTLTIVSTISGYSLLGGENE